MKKIFVVVGVVIVVFITCFFINEINFNHNRVVKHALGDIIMKQREMDKKIEKMSKNKKYTLKNPEVIVNPYGLTPLTALIIFYTPDSKTISVNINDRFSFETEESKQHIIPIYGMYPNYENVIRLKSGNEKSEVNIKTENYDGDLLEVKTSQKDLLNDELYFLSPNFVENCIYDKEGNLLWYIDGDYAGDIEFLDNGHFYISDPNQGTNGVKINYSSFLEMDYLGKIYKQYITEYGYHHELVVLENGDILTTGAKDGSPFLEAVLYIIDVKTGKTKYYIDFYEKFHDLAPEWIESLGDNFDFVLNSIDYDKDSNDVLLSFRGIGVIARMNLDTKEFKWMFGDPDNLPKEFNKYLLKISDNTKYPYGEHSAFFTKDGNVSFHNNDADQFNMKSDILKDYINRYTTNVVFKVNEKKKTLNTIWEYDANKREFSKVGGYLKFLDNGHALINYGWSIKQSAYKNPNKISISDTNYLNGIILELDKDKNVLFHGVMDGLIFRVYKMNFYQDIVKNYEIIPYEKVDGIKKDKPVSETKSINNGIRKAKKYNDNIDVFVNRIIIDSEFKINDYVEIILKNRYGKIYQYIYKEKNKDIPHFNSGRYGIKVSLPNGKYNVYIKKNNDYYKTNIQLIFE